MYLNVIKELRPKRQIIFKLYTIAGIIILRLLKISFTSLLHRYPIDTPYILGA